MHDLRRPACRGDRRGDGRGADRDSPATRDVLVESAEFDPVSIRNTARILNLHSDSSFRFERRVDPEGLDWASRRCCELILEEAGGQLAAGAVDVGGPPPERKPIVLRFSQLKRILGIDVPPERVRAILLALGNKEEGTGTGARVGRIANPSYRSQGPGGSGQWSVVGGQGPATHTHPRPLSRKRARGVQPSSPQAGGGTCRGRSIGRGGWRGFTDTNAFPKT